mmetsp:Transcript_41910/g.131956  ORF Transcript_41910/g.131956 Transcript_41910/m.131956 type:complete len:268 (+) Transcript_41910:463-1266(+)
MPQQLQHLAVARRPREGGCGLPGSRSPLKQGCRCSRGQTQVPQQRLQTTSLSRRVQIVSPPLESCLDEGLHLPPSRRARGLLHQLQRLSELRADLRQRPALCLGQSRGLLLVNAAEVHAEVAIRHVAASAKVAHLGGLLGPLHAEAEAPLCKALHDLDRHPPPSLGVEEREQHVTGQVEAPKPTLHHRQELPRRRHLGHRLLGVARLRRAGRIPWLLALQPRRVLLGELRHVHSITPRGRFRGQCELCIVERQSKLAQDCCKVLERR